ncbi:MAG TPA: helix-turn-helix transcriptional regulator [Gammaproteobacteria bacterium]
MTLGDRIKLVREEKGITQQQLAEMSGVCQQMISKLETGKANATSDIVKLAYCLEVSPNWLEGLSKNRNVEAAPRSKAGAQQTTQGEKLNQKALQACIEFLTQDPPRLFARSGFRKQSEIFSKCYALCTQSKNKSLSKPDLVDMLKRRGKRL